jgi:hypothetical protein
VTVHVYGRPAMGIPSVSGMPVLFYSRRGTLLGRSTTDALGNACGFVWIDEPASDKLGDGARRRRGMGRSRGSERETGMRGDELGTPVTEVRVSSRTRRHRPWCCQTTRFVDSLAPRLRRRSAGSPAVTPVCLSQAQPVAAEVMEARLALTTELLYPSRNSSKRRLMSCPGSELNQRHADFQSPGRETIS